MIHNELVGLPLRLALYQVLSESWIPWLCLVASHCKWEREGAVDEHTSEPLGHEP